MKDNYNNSQTLEIIIPTLNEEHNIGQLIKEIRSLSFPITPSILITDAGSTDNTVEICKKENVQVIKRKGKGKGIGMKEAAQYSSADIIVFIDGDRTYPISDLGLLLEPILNDEADMTVGSRMLGKREKGSISTLNLIGNKIFNNTVNFALKSKVSDSQSGFRVLKRKMFNDLILLSDEFDIEVEITVEALSRGYRVIEVPINYKNRQDSETKLNPLKDGTKIFKTLFFVIMNVRPILFFSIMSGIIFGISVYPTVLVLHEKFIIGEIIHIPAVILASVLIITAIILLVLGILSELIVRSRRRLEYILL